MQQHMVASTNNNAAENLEVKDGGVLIPIANANVEAILGPPKSCQIDIQFIQLALPFPSNLSSLQSLQKLIISGANLTGTIPQDIGDCVSLVTLDVSSNGPCTY
ncbi:hypothetical protein KY284_036426 [Solanum tuberosum]|nr:hypothetical protein KY284_036426 [Solanum tuberosum]